MSAVAGSEMLYSSMYLLYLPPAAYQIALQTSNKPLMGICLGFQLLFDSSNEIERTAGLGILSGEVEKFYQ